MSDYKIVEDEFTNGLESRVKKLLKDGYEPQGGVFVNQGYVCQSMFKADVDIMEVHVGEMPVHPFRGEDMDFRDKAAGSQFKDK